MKEGTIVDATIIAAPCPTRNARRERDPEPERSGDSRPCSFSNNSRQMHQTKKGNQWCFGMKAHIGVDAKPGLVHRVSGTAASVADAARSHELLHGKEKEVYADAGYTGVEKRTEIVEGHAGVEWHVAARRGKVKALAEGLVKDLTLRLEKAKAQVRARVEHPFHVIKNLFKHRKVRCRGLARNTARLYSLFALANLVIARHALLSTAEA